MGYPKWLIEKMAPDFIRAKQAKKAKEAEAKQAKEANEAAEAKRVLSQKLEPEPES